MACQVLQRMWLVSKLGVMQLHSRPAVLQPELSENRHLQLLCRRILHVLNITLITVACSKHTEANRCWRPCRPTVTITYLGVSLNTGNLHGDAFLNCFLSALVEIPAYFLSWGFFRWCSRRVTVFSTLCMAGMFLLIIQLIPAGMSRTAVLQTSPWCYSKYCIL